LGAEDIANLKKKVKQTNMNEKYTNMKKMKTIMNELENKHE